MRIAFLGGGNMASALIGGLLARGVKRSALRVVERAITGMIPHNRLGRQIAKKLKVYAGGEHPHEAQQPEAFSL